MWKSIESFQSNDAVQNVNYANVCGGGLSELEVQLLVIVRRLISHRFFSREKERAYTLESMPSQTTLIKPIFTSVPEPKETISAKSMLQSASQFATKHLPKQPIIESSDTAISLVDIDGELHPADEEFVGESPMMTLIFTFLNSGLVNAQ